MSSVSLLKELLIISLGKQDRFKHTVSENDWKNLFYEAQKQCVIGPLFSGLERLPIEQRPPKACLLQWIGIVELVESANRQQLEKITIITNSFRNAGFRSCLLKGQGASLLYPYPLRRQSGDIDLWVDGDRKKIVDYCENSWKIDHVDVKNIVVKSIPNVTLEVHFIPSWFYSPFRNKNFSQWYRSQWEAQFTHTSEKGFCVPTIDFNLVYLLVHIYRHQFEEGIGLRQLMDYYYVLMNSLESERNTAAKRLKQIGLVPFCRAVMYAMADLFKLEENYLLYEPDERLGTKLMETILKGGNFGQYDEKNAHGIENRIERGIRNLRHNIGLLADYPSEVLWSPLWKCWHWAWRKKRGYL